MLKEDEQVNTLSQDVQQKKPKKKSKKLRKKLKDAAGDGFRGVEVKRKEIEEVRWESKVATGGNGDVDGGLGDVEVRKLSRKRRKRGSSGGEGVGVGRDEEDVAVVEAEVVPKRRDAAMGLSFLDKMRARLSGGQFRMLNETLYTCRGEDAFKLFQKDEGAFQLYHTGYQEQMSHWPKLPVQVVMDWLKGRSPNLVVADFGCGDARLARGVKNKVHSMDLVACEDFVIACNMAKTPLKTDSVDVAVFSLSLMGVDYPSFLKEAHRVLKGFLLIAEVKSRFDSANGGADINQFVEALKRLGFFLVSQDDKNKMFIMFTFKKQEENVGKTAIDWPYLKPCVYKKR